MRSRCGAATQSTRAWRCDLGSGKGLVKLFCRQQKRTRSRCDAANQSTGGLI